MTDQPAEPVAREWRSHLGWIVTVGGAIPLLSEGLTAEHNALVSAYLATCKKNKALKAKVEMLKTVLDDTVNHRGEILYRAEAAEARCAVKDAALMKARTLIAVEAKMDFGPMHPADAELLANIDAALAGKE